MEENKKTFKKELLGVRQSLDQAEILDLVGVQAGFMAQIYGKIKNFKTYFGTVMAILTANSGQVVYVNWPIDWSGFDEREHFRYRLLGLLGLKKEFKRYPSSNLKFVDLSDVNDVKIQDSETGELRSTGLDFYHWIRTLTSCTIFLDEGHIYYDSYMALKMKLEDRLPILETAHYDRAVYVISQRSGAIHAVLRGNVNIFYKCEKISKGWWIFKPKFRVVEFQETGSDEKPNEERETIVDPETGKKSYGEYLWAEAITTFRAKKEIFAKYNSKYRRLGARESQPNNAEVYRVTWKQNFKNIFV